MADARRHLRVLHRRGDTRHGRGQPAAASGASATSARRSSVASGTSRPTSRRPTPRTRTSSCSRTPTARTPTTRPGSSCSTASPSTAPAVSRRWSTGSGSPTSCDATSRITSRCSSSVAVPGQYIGDGSHLVAARPVFRHDDTGALVQVSFNNADRAPFLLPADEMKRFYDAMRAFEARANDHRMQWRRVLSPGIGDALRQLARPARTHVVHRSSSPLRRLREPRGLREPSPSVARTLLTARHDGSDVTPTASRTPRHGLQSR